MQVEVKHQPNLAKIENLYVLLPEDSKFAGLSFPEALRGLLAPTIEASGFTGRNDTSITIVHGTAPARITLIGLGKEKDLSIRRLRAALHSVAKSARKNRDKSIALFFPYTVPPLDDAATTRLVADLLAHSDYQYDRYITVHDDGEKVPIRCVYVAPSSVDPKLVRQLGNEAAAIAAAVRTVRDLGNGPGNLVTPSFIAARAQEVAAAHGLTCTVWDKKQIVKMKMGGLLAVNRGSAEEPRFIVLEHAPKGAKKTICLVGKGITFDSGGISIKPADRMEEMKFDMSGAAAVIGTLQACAALKVRHRVIGVIASTDNMPSGAAYKPGDIITTMSGKTIEIVNTDAEGRVILADALHYASQLKPDHIIDFATLTGACVVALGNEASGLFTADSELANQLTIAGEQVGERLWRLPEWDDYRDLVRSDWADVKNSGGRWGGATTAAVFLKQFVDNASYAHIDIAGTAYAEHPNAQFPRGSTGVGVRMTVEFLRSLA